MANLEPAEDALALPEESWIGAHQYKESSVENKVEFIARLMLQGLWDKDAERACVDEWCCSRTWVRQLSARASHHLEVTLKDRSTMQGILALRIRHFAEQEGQVGVQGTKLMAEVMGATRQRNQEMTQEESRQNFIDLIRAGDANLMSALADALDGAPEEIREQVREML